MHTTDANGEHSWQNWSGSEKSHPRHILKPRTVEELQAQVRDADHCRTVGAGHSFTPVARTDATLLSLENLGGITDLNSQTNRASLLAGTHLKNLKGPLTEAGFSLINQGDIDQQSIAGAVSTSTHGTGIQFGSFADQVRGFDLVLASGDKITCNPTQNARIYEAGRVNVGTFGVFSNITLEVLPRYKLKEFQYVEKLSTVLANIDQLKTENRHFEFFPFVYAGDYAVVKLLNISDEPVQTVKKPLISEDTLVTFFCELARYSGFFNRHIQKLLPAVVSETIRVDWSCFLFPSPRNTMFNEMEYELPAENGIACLEEVLATIRRAKVNVFFPLEFRFVKQDDCWMSPFYKQDSASISLHQYTKQDHWELFKVAEPVFRKYGGRPHWGKIHSLSHAELCELYPKWDEFHALRRELDPNGKFMNVYLKHIMGS